MLPHVHRNNNSIRYTVKFSNKYANFDEKKANNLGYLGPKKMLQLIKILPLVFKSNETT